MLKFKNIGQEQIDVGKPAELGGRIVPAGDVFEVDGVVTDELGDCYLVGEGDNVRAWPKAQWELIKSEAKSAKAAEKES